MELLFSISGANFYKNFQKKTRTKIEREVEKIHPTVYFNDKFTVCRLNPKYYGYFSNLSYDIEEQVRLVEDFDIEWHLLNFLKNKLTYENPSLIFRWMIPEKPKPEPQQAPPPQLRSLFNDNLKHTIQHKQEKRYPVKPIETSNPVWLVKRIPSTKLCDCGKRYSIYSATREIRPNKELDKTITTIVKCEVCLIDLQKSFFNAIWKFAQDDQSKCS